MKVTGEANFISEDIKQSYIKTEAEESSTADIESIPVEALTLEVLEVLRITKEKNIPKPEPSFTINGASIAIAGGVTGISAVQKAGKTGTQVHFIANALSPTGYTVDSLTGLEVLANEKRLAVVAIDTEQSKQDQQSNVVSILKLSRYDSTPSHGFFYNVRSLSRSNYKPLVSRIVELCSAERGGVHSIYLDGGADFTKSVNDEEGSIEAVDFFTKLADKYACPVFVIVHLNPNNTKERGHFGSELLRRCYAMLTIEKKNDISCLTCKAARKAGESDTQGIFYKYSKEKGYHVSIDAPADSENKVQNDIDKKVKYYTSLAMKALPAQTALSNKDFADKLIGITDKSAPTVDRMIKVMRENNIISKGDDGLYRLQNAS